MGRVIFRTIREKRDRILALDLLRGTFLVVIFVDHVAWSPTIYDFISGQSHLFASAAEGFFAISGILVGYIYGKKIVAQTRQTTLKILKRAGWLYILAVGFTCLYSFITLFLPLNTVRDQYLYSNFGQFLFDTFTLQFTYGWADFLSRYALLMLFSPIVLWLIAKRRAWIVATASLAIWYFLRNSPINNFTAWQILFYFTVIIGYYLPSIEKRITSLPKKTKRYMTITLYTAALSTYLLSVTLTIILPLIAGVFGSNMTTDAFSSITHIIDVKTLLDSTIFNRDTMEPARIIVGMIWFSALYVFYRYFEKSINKYTQGSLLLLGTNSLYVYGLQSFILFFMDIFLKPPQETTILQRTIVTSAALIIVYIMTRQRSYFKQLKMRTIDIWNKS